VVVIKQFINQELQPQTDTHLKASFQDNLDDEVAVASAGPNANYLHLTPDR